MNQLFFATGISIDEDKLNKVIEDNNGFNIEAGTIYCIKIIDDLPSSAKDYYQNVKITMLYKSQADIEEDGETTVINDLSYEYDFEDIYNDTITNFNLQKYFVIAPSFGGQVDFRFTFYSEGSNNCLILHASKSYDSNETAKVNIELSEIKNYLTENVKSIKAESKSNHVFVVNKDIYNLNKNNIFITSEEKDIYFFGILELKSMTTDDFLIIDFDIE